MNTTKKRAKVRQIEEVVPRPAPPTSYPVVPGAGTQFGDYEDTRIGADLTLEWDSIDPDLHQHMLKPQEVSEEESAEDQGWNVEEAGIPDA